MRRREPIARVMRLKGGGWQGRFWYTNLKGCRTRFRLQISSGGTRREAEKIATELQRQANRLGYVLGYNDPPPPPKVDRVYTFSGFAEKWFRDYVEPNNSLAEQESKRSSLRVHLIPYFGDTDLRDIKEEKVDAFRAFMLKKRVEKNPGERRAKKKVLENEARRTLSRTTVKYHLGVLRKMLVKAAKWQYIDRVPEFEKIKIDEKDHDWYTEEERDLFLGTCKAYRPEWYAFFATAFFTGMRMGELYSLRWEDVQFNSQIPFIRVRRSNWRGHEKSTKSGKARSIPMNSVLLAVLKRHQHLQGPLVFYNEAGKPMDINGGRKVFKWVCRKAGIRTLRRHDIRHSFASHVVARTGNIVALQDMLGHADLTTTRRYSHLAPKLHQDIVEAIAPKADLAEMADRSASSSGTSMKLATEVATESPKLKIVGGEQ